MKQFCCIFRPRWNIKIKLYGRHEPFTCTRKARHALHHRMPWETLSYFVGKLGILPFWGKTNKNVLKRRYTRH